VFRLIAAGVVAALSVPWSAGEARAQDGASSSEPMEVLEVLQQAQAARSERLELESSARAEAARVAAQTAEAEARAQLAKTRARRTREAIEALRAEAGPLDAREAELTTRMDGVARRVNEALDGLEARLLPGIVAATAKPAPARAEDRFEAALERLEKTERRLSQIEVNVIETQLDGADVAVEVLRFGGAAAWWRGLEGGRFGVVRVEDGEVDLEPRSGDALAERVETAFAVAKGRAAPELIMLPLVPLGPNGKRGPAS